MDILGNGIYSISEVARLAGLRSRRVRTWFLGMASRVDPIMRSDYPVTGAPHVLSFLDLIDTVVVGQLRHLGLGFAYLRRLRDELAREFDTMHPFSRKNLLTDGERVFIHILDELGEQELREAITHQHAFPEVLLPYLRQLEYDPSSLLARRWHIDEGIVIDPERQFGKPIVVDSGVPAAILAAAYLANDQDAETVADWYGVDLKEVHQAVAFENELNGRAA